MSHYECKKCHKRYDYCTCGQEKTSFKVGDKVFRNEKDSIPWNQFCKEAGIDPDSPVTIDDIDGINLCFREVRGTGWDSKKFKLASDKLGNNMVTQPKHYEFFDGVEAITIIARSMTEKQFAGYCMGNALKYRLRAGKKFNTEEDLKKADYYKELFQKHRHECIDEDI